MVSVFFVCGEYAITRPASNALFLTLFSSKGYPWVWLATVPLNFLAIYCYNRFLPTIGPFRTLCILALATIAINALTGAWVAQFPPLIFFQYAWKDIYVLLMLKQIWSMIHSTISVERSKILYGWIYGMGTLGGICGSLIPAFFASHFGSSKILFFTLPIYLFFIFSYKMALQRSAVQVETFASDLTQNARPAEAFSLIRRSPILMAILLLVIFMQVSVGLMEYQFNAHLELNIAEQDLRTAYYAKVSSLVNLLSLALQLFGGFLMVRILGLRRSHFLIPILLCSSALLSFSLPTFAILSGSYLFLKAVDFSLFGIIREMLYTPLQLDAKFRAKAVIDVFAYRTSRAIVSVGLLLLQWIASVSLLQLAPIISLIVLFGWLAAVYILFRKEKFLGYG